MADRRIEVAASGPSRHLSLKVGSGAIMGTRQGNERRSERVDTAAWIGTGRLPGRQAFHERLTQALQARSRGGGPTEPLAVMLLRMDHMDHMDRLAEAGAGAVDASPHASKAAVGDTTGESLQMHRTVIRLSGMPELFAGVWRLNVRVYACLAREPAARGREPLAALARGLLRTLAPPAWPVQQQAAALPQLRPSIGIAVYPSDGSTGAALLRRAEAATLRASRLGLGLAFFERQSDL